MPPKGSSSLPCSPFSVRPLLSLAVFSCPCSYASFVPLSGSSFSSCLKRNAPPFQHPLRVPKNRHFAKIRHRLPNLSTNSPRSHYRSVTAAFVSESSSEISVFAFYVSSLCTRPSPGPCSASHTRSFWLYSSELSVSFPSFPSL